MCARLSGSKTLKGIRNFGSIAGILYHFYDDGSINI